MPKVTIHFEGMLQYSIGCSALEIVSDQRVTFREAVQLAAEQTGKKLLPYIADPGNGEILPWIVIFVNRENIRHLQGWNTLLDEKDEITIMRADMAGG
jgi:molybdopterin converting factor small subunit